MAHALYCQQHAAMPPPEKPETFMLSNEAIQSLPHDAQVALDQVEKRKSKRGDQSSSRGTDSPAQ